MTIGSPSCFISASRGSVMGSRSTSGASGLWGTVDIRASSGDEGRGLVVDLDDLVAARDVDDPGRVGRELLLVVGRVRDHDDGVAALHQPGRGAVDLHLPRARLAG